MVKRKFFSSFEVGHNSIVCKHENNLIGFAIFSLVKEECHLLNIAVIKSWHRKGAGSLLMNTLIRQSKVLGAKKVFLEVRSKNYNAISFYKKYKFVQDALRINYYAGNNPDDAVMMSLDI